MFHYIDNIKFLSIYIHTTTVNIVLTNVWIDDDFLFFSRTFFFFHNHIPNMKLVLQLRMTKRANPPIVNPSKTV